MRFSSLSTFGLALAATANAAFVKRGISAQVQACINDLNMIESQITVVDGLVSTYDRSKGYSGAFAIHNAEQVLEGYLNNALTHCGSVSSATEEECSGVLSVVDVVVSNIEQTLSDVGAKKSEFDAVLLATALIKSDLKNLNVKATNLDNYVYNFCPSDMKSTAQGYVDRITAAFTAVKAIYGI